MCMLTTYLNTGFVYIVLNHFVLHLVLAEMVC